MIQKNRNLLLTVCLIIAVLVASGRDVQSTSSSFSQLNNEDTNLVSDSLHAEASVILKISQQTAQFPQVRVDSISLAEEYPETGKAIDATITIVSEDPLDYPGFRLVVLLTEVIEDRGPLEQEDPIPLVVVNKSLSIVPSMATLTEVVSFDAADAGFYTISGMLTVQGAIIPDSTSTIAVEVLTEPIGDDLSLWLSLAGIGAFLILVMMSPSVIDKIRIANRKRRNGLPRAAEAN